ncbi:MAG TPA: hypothetical protein VM346_10925 [Sphingomicrobium sp.]|nr:hypothetical protein [Sphingomicrobium sp.]
MILVWHYYWPVVAVGFLAGLVACWVALQGKTAHINVDDARSPPRHPLRKRLTIFAVGAFAAIIAAALWHGPVGAGSRLTAFVEADARAELDRLEMTAVEALAERAPLKRSLVLSGPADEFQRREIRRLMAQTPGIVRARWADEGGGYRLPLLAEAALAALLGFPVGALLAYLIIYRRRENATWSWG